MCLKTISDCVEALIRAYYYVGGWSREAFSIPKWLQIETGVVEEISDCEIHVHICEESSECECVCRNHNFFDKIISHMWQKWHMSRIMYHAENFHLD